MVRLDDDPKSFLYGLDPTTTLFTFMLQTHPSVKTVRLLGSWDNFAMTYAMERDSRRDRGQWRGCHTFQDIINDGDASTERVSRSGGLKMGHTYYYYYELDGCTETHDPAMPSTSTCPYLPGQRVNTLTVPVQKSSRKRSASVNSLQRCEFQTMNPADRFVTPRPPPATPSVAPAVGPELKKSLVSSARRPHSPSPRLLLRHRRSTRSLSPAPALSIWSPRRLFVRKSSPTRDVSDGEDDYEKKDTRHVADDVVVVAQQDEQPPLSRPAPPPRLASSSSISSFSSMSRLHRPAGPSSAYASSVASQGSRSRDISPESLRRFLVEDAPLESLSESIPEGNSLSVSNTTATVLTPCIPERSDEDENEDDCDSLTFDFDDDDEHNFAVSAASESAPFTVLSPPPPTPARILKTAPKQRPSNEESRRTASLTYLLVEEEPAPAAQLPDAPTRPPPVVPAMSWLDLDDAVSPVSPALSSSLPSPPSFRSPQSHGASSVAQSEATDDDDDEDDRDLCGPVGEPIALFLPPPQHPFYGSDGSSSSSGSGSRQDAAGPAKMALLPHNHHHDYLVAAALTGSTTTLVPGTSGVVGGDGASGLNDLVDELGWMATAIQS